MPQEELEQLRSALRDAGVPGAGEFGLFVNDTRHRRASAFDSRAALPLLIQALPSLTTAQAVAAVAGHLAGAWSWPALPTLTRAFRCWARRDPLEAGWQLGNAIAAAANEQHAEALLELSADRQFGTARQMIVYSLWRFRRHPAVRSALPGLCHDRDVALHAMSALRRAVGHAEALPTLLQIAAAHPDAHVRGSAARAVRKAREALAASQGC